MTRCEMSMTRLSAWLDGEAGRRTEEIARHVAQCPACSEQVASWRQGGEMLRQVVDVGVGELDPLVATDKIYERIRAAQSRSFYARLRAAWAELWNSYRLAFAGVGAAAALGALTAPVVLWMLAHPGQRLSGDGREAVAPVASAESSGIQLDIKLIEDRPENHGIDPRLEDLSEDLSARRLRAPWLLNQAVLTLELESSGRLALPDRAWLNVVPRLVLADGRLQLELQSDSLAFRQRVILRAGTPLVVEGPLLGQRPLILVMTYRE